MAKLLWIEDRQRVDGFSEFRFSGDVHRGLDVHTPRYMIFSRDVSAWLTKKLTRTNSPVKAPPSSGPRTEAKPKTAPKDLQSSNTLRASDDSGTVLTVRDIPKKFGPIFQTRDLTNDGQDTNENCRYWSDV